MGVRFLGSAAASLALCACGGGSDPVQTDSGGGGTGQTTTLLQLTGISGAKDSINRHAFAVPTGGMKLAVSTEGGAGNVDIAVLGPADRDCESAGTGTTELCEIPSPTAGNWQVGLLGTGDYSDVTLTVALTVPGTAPPPAASDPPEEPAPVVPPVTQPEPVTPPVTEPEPVTPPVMDPVVPPVTEPIAPPVTPPVTTPVTPPTTPPPDETPPPDDESPPPTGGNEEPPPDSPPADGQAGITLIHGGAVRPAGFVAAGDRVFFTASEGSSSARRLWISDATAAGTRALSDSLQPSAMLALGNGVVFTARNPDGQHALWYADTGGSVRHLVTFARTPESSGGDASLIGVFGNRLFFIGDDGSHGRELWSSDGTASGTRMVADVHPQGDAQFDARQAWTWWSGRLYLYAAAEGRRGIAQLYSTNGDAGDLRQLTFATTDARDLSRFDMAVYKNRLYFTWHARDEGVELWSTDGSANGTQPFFDSLPGRDRSGSPSSFNVVGGRLLFSAYFPGGSTRGLFASDGTPSGTALIREVEIAADARRMVPVNGRHLFPGRVTSTGSHSLWATDGTAAGTIEVSGEVHPADARFTSSMPGADTATVGGRLVFLGRNSAQGYEPWVTDGTRSGTRRLADLNAGSASSFDDRHGEGWIAPFGGKAYFTAAVAESDFRLFETDGTNAGTRQVSPADATVRTNTRGDGRSPLPEPFAFGDHLLFGARYYADGPAVLFGL